METFFSTLLRCTLSMSVITLLYASILPLLSKRYAPKWRYMIWLVIAAGWLIPFRPLIRVPFLSVQNAIVPLLPVQFTPLYPMIRTQVKVSAAAPEALSNMPHLSIWTMGIFIWLLGIIIMLAYQILRHLRFMKMVNRWSESITTPEILHLLDVLKQEQGIKANMEYKTCSIISSPMMVGFFHPVILMPPIQLSKNELTMILRHELTHFKRHDLWYKTIVLAATILHWFNPVVYIMARATSVQCEIACDALVLHNKDILMRKQYGETILAVVRSGRTFQTALSTNFYGGKQGMKNRITSMLDSKRKKTGIAVLCIVLVGIMLAGASLVTKGSQVNSIPNTVFTNDEYAKLLALRFDGYEDMSVSEFQQKVWQKRDTAEYMALLERFYKDEQLNDMKDKNDIAAFLFYELTPLTAENWKSRNFGKTVMTNYEKVDDNAQFEFTCSIDIADAAGLTVGEYSQARKGVMNGLILFFQSQSEKVLQNEAGMNKAIETEIDTLTQQWSNNVLTIRVVDYSFIPLRANKSNESTELSSGNDIEERRYPYGTEEDYHSLLKLKTGSYKNQTVADFNADILDWANENYERVERIDTDIAWNDFAVSLNQEEKSFVTLTYNLSGMENASMIKSSHTKGSKEDISFSHDLPYKTLEQVMCSLYYKGSYQITDDSLITIEERDRCVGSVLNDIQKFWNITDMEELLAMNEADIVAELQDIASQYSNSLITISIIPDQVSFEKIDERGNRD